MAHQLQAGMLAPASKPDAAALADPATGRAWKAAQDFEGMVLGELLGPMLATIPSASAPFGGGQAEETWRAMQGQEMGRHIARGGGLGLAVPVFRQILAMQEAARTPPPEDPT